MEKGVAGSSNWRRCSAPQASLLFPRWGPPHHPPQRPLGHASRNAVPSQDGLWVSWMTEKSAKLKLPLQLASSSSPVSFRDREGLFSGGSVFRPGSSILSDLIDLSWGILPSKTARLHFWWAWHITQPNHSCLQRRSACLSHCFPKILIVLKKKKALSFRNSTLRLEDTHLNRFLLEGFLCSQYLNKNCEFPIPEHAIFHKIIWQQNLLLHRFSLGNTLRERRLSCRSEADAYGGLCWNRQEASWSFSESIRVPLLSLPHATDQSSHLLSHTTPCHCFCHSLSHILVPLIDFMLVSFYFIVGPFQSGNWLNVQAPQETHRNLGARTKSGT